MNFVKYKWYIVLLLILSCVGGVLAFVGPSNLGLATGKAKSCNDTDGGNVPNVFGTVYGYANNSYYNNSDYCVNSGTVLEFYCNGTAKKTQQQSCGANGYVGGNYCLNGSVYKDYRTFSCAKGACKSTTAARLQQACQNGCANGTCLQSNVTANNSCSDTDGGLVFNVKGTVSGYLNGAAYSYTDACITNITLREWYCSGATALNRGNYTCNVGNYSACSNGRCI